MTKRESNTAPYNIPREAELLAFALTDHCNRGNTFKSAIDVAADALRLAYEVGVQTRRKRRTRRFSMREYKYSIEKPMYGSPQQWAEFLTQEGCRVETKRLANGLQRDFTIEYRKGYQDALKMAKENFLTPDLCKNVMDCVRVVDQLMEPPDEDGECLYVKTWNQP